MSNDSDSIRRLRNRIGSSAFHESDLHPRKISARWSVQRSTTLLRSMNTLTWLRVCLKVLLVTKGLQGQSSLEWAQQMGNLSFPLGFHGFKIAEEGLQ